MNTMDIKPLLKDRYAKSNKQGARPAPSRFPKIKEFIGKLKPTNISTTSPGAPSPGGKKRGY